MAVEPTTSYQDINEDVVHAYNADLKQFADHATVFTALEGMVTPGHITQVPGAAIFKYQLKDMQVDVTTRMAMPLKLAASYGDNQVRETQGEESRYKVRRAFANSYFKVMDQKDNKRTFGGHAKGKALFDLASKLLKDHGAWTRDDFFHQAVLDGVSANLTSAASGGPALTPSVAKNIYIHGADNLAHTLPAYSNNPTTHLATLMTALNTVTGDASAVPIVDLFSRL